MQLLLPLVFLLRKKKRRESRRRFTVFTVPFFFFLFRWVSDDIEKIKQVFFFSFFPEFSHFIHTHTHTYEMCLAQNVRETRPGRSDPVCSTSLLEHVFVSLEDNQKENFLFFKEIWNFFFFFNPPSFGGYLGGVSTPPKKKNFYFGDKKKRKSTPRTGKEAAAIIIFFPSITTTNKKKITPSPFVW